MKDNTSLKTILVVDDDEDIRDLLVSQLGMLGHASITAENGRECLLKVKQNRPNLIIMDIRMPLMDGITTLKHLRAGNETVPVVVYSGFLDDDTISLSSSLGAVQVYSKPFSLNDLEDAINRHSL